jgi:hypothetical protein
MKTRDERGRFLPGNPSRWIPRTDPSPDRLKRCTSCKDWLPVRCFTKDKTAPDGRERRCKACRYARRAFLARKRRALAAQRRARLMRRLLR